MSQFEPGNHPALAQGNLWALLDESSCKQKFARASYGVQAHVQFDEVLHADLSPDAKRSWHYGQNLQKELFDRIIWCVRKDEDISDDVRYIRGYIKVESSFNDIDLTQDLYTSRHGEVAMKSDYYNVEAELKSGKITKIGTILLPIGGYKAMGLRMQRDGTNRRYLNVAYQIEILCKGMLSMVRFTVPYGGEFPDADSPFEYGPRAKQAHFHLRDLQAIEARHGDREAASENN